MSERTAVYKAFDAAGALLYVGIAKNWGYRWSQHSERSYFFAAVTRLEIEWCETRPAALAREAALIRAERPPYNVRDPRPAAADRSLALAGRCEVCHCEPASAFSWFADRGRWYGERSGAWKVTGDCSADSAHYAVSFARWIREDDWLAHLRDKEWFDEADFLDAVHRVPSRQIQAAARRQARA